MMLALANLYFWVWQPMRSQVSFIPPAIAPTPSPTLVKTQPWIIPAQGTISQNFHFYHEGIDISGTIGVPIVAAQAGTVIKAGWDDWGLGNAVRIMHIDGSQTVYGHNQRLLVNTGDRVTQGQIIAEMGSTGNSTGPHLHFEMIDKDENPIDPKKLINFGGFR